MARRLVGEIGALRLYTDDDLPEGHRCFGADEATEYGGLPCWIEERMKGEDMLCDVCGEDMTMPNKETTLVGIQIRLAVGKTADEPTRRWYAEQIAPFELDRNYCICFPCWLRSLGVRPDCPVDSPVLGDPLIVY